MENEFKRVESKCTTCAFGSLDEDQEPMSHLFRGKGPL